MLPLLRPPFGTPEPASRVDIAHARVYNSLNLMLRVRRSASAKGLLAIPLILLTLACAQAAPARQVSPNHVPEPVAAAAATPSNDAAPQSDNLSSVVEAPTSPPGPAVQIIAVHAAGTLSPTSCCNEALIERDEFVAIRNMSLTPQDIRGWTLKNATKGYPTFTFPDRFPCVAYNALPIDYPSVPGGYYTFRQVIPETVDQTFTKSHVLAGPVYSQDQIDWSQCTATQPLDDSPLAPTTTGQGTVPPLILYPGQTVLVFTDEIHCRYGGLSFNYGLGSIWSNDHPDVAVLYDAQGNEVSRKSYTIGGK